MKAIVIDSEQEVEDIIYPCLMQTELKTIVLFISPKEGIVMQNKKGYYNIADKIHDDFNLKYFKPFNGSITLSND